MVVPNSHVHCARVPCAGLGINHRDPESHRVTGLGGFQLRPRKPVGLVLAEWPVHHDSRLVGVGVGGGFGFGFGSVSVRFRSGFAPVEVLMECDAGRHKSAGRGEKARPASHASKRTL